MRPSAAAGFGPISPLRKALLLLLPAAVAFLLFGCSHDPQAEATDELVASFEGSLAQPDIAEAQTAFQEGRYKESLHLLHKVARRDDLTDRQKTAMAGIVGQLLQIVQDDPELARDTQLHRLMEMLVLRTIGEP